MATEAQTIANGLNAQKSTGPRTDQGKAASRLNSFKHGLTALKVFPAEKQDEFLALSHDYREHYQPVGVEEAHLLETMIFAAWNRGRYAQIHEQLWQALMETGDHPSMAHALLADLSGPRAVDKLFRYVRDLERMYDRARKGLHTAQCTRAEQQLPGPQAQPAAEVRPGPQPAPGPAPVTPPVTASAPTPEIGFVSSPDSSKLTIADYVYKNPQHRRDNPALRL